MKIKRKTAVWLIGACAAVMVWGCGSGGTQKKEADGVAVTDAAAEMTAGTAAGAAVGSGTSGSGLEALPGSDTSIAEEQGTGIQGTEVDGEAGPGAQEETEMTETELPASVEVFAEKVQEAVADKDMEALADLIKFPLTLVSTDKEKIVIAEREELLKQNPDMIFGDDLMIAIANVDTAVLTPENDMVVMGDENSYLLFREIGKGVFAVTDIQE